MTRKLIEEDNFGSPTLIDFNLRNRGIKGLRDSISVAKAALSKYNNSIMFMMIVPPKDKVELF